MKEATKRSIVRWVHIVFAIPIVGYVYSPFEEIPNYAPVVRYAAVPAIVLTGFWMWKGHLLRRLFRKATPSNMPKGTNGTESLVKPMVSETESS